MALSEKCNIPQHIAIIMDGNGRWAKKRGLPRTAGHAAGAESFRKIANYCRSIGVKYLTVYAFSTENWKRSEEEVAGIMKLLGRYLKEALQDMSARQLMIVPWENASATKMADLKAKYPEVTDIGILIGPEGGITEGEVEDTAAHAVTLGPRILRAETAAVTSAALAMALWGDI